MLFQHDSVQIHEICFAKGMISVSYCPMCRLRSALVSISIRDVVLLCFNIDSIRDVTDSCVVIASSLFGRICQL